MSERFEVVCVGAATWDHVAAVERWPDRDGRVRALDVSSAGGGTAATAAVAMARLGLKVAFVGSVGEDETGALIRSGLADEGVDVADLHVVPGARSPTSVIYADVRAGTRSIASYRGTAGAPSLSDRAEERCRSAEWVHVDHIGYPAVSAALGSANGMRLSADPQGPIDELRLESATLFAPSEPALAARYPGLSLPDAVAAAVAEGAETVVVTRGSEGSFGATAEETASAPPFPAEIVSTLGAGDVFHGALVAAFVRGASLAEALRSANAAAALSCRALDGRSAIPTASELAAALAAGSGETGG